MKKMSLFCLLLMACGLLLASREAAPTNTYVSAYRANLEQFLNKQQQLLQLVENSNCTQQADLERIRTALHDTRNSMKEMDIWLRYLEPIAYKKINGPLPVEWETEVFEKFEPPYRRDGAGLTLAELYLGESVVQRDSLAALIRSSLQASEIFAHDSITAELGSYHHFFLCNRLFLLNLAAIYTTGFECPAPEQVIPELQKMMGSAEHIYSAFNESYPATAVNTEYLALYHKSLQFVAAQQQNPEQFDHFGFIRDYINPLFILNQQMIRNYRVISKSVSDYTLNKEAGSIFSKDLYNGQNAKGVYFNVADKGILAEIDRLGKLLFYDPLLSGNNERSCASCHKPTQYFTDTTTRTAMQFGRQGLLNRNTPSLINANYNHLVMADGKHISLQDQTHAVITSKEEMGCAEQDILQKVLSCRDYKKAFNRLLPYTPQEPELSIAHISSAITFYYSKFSKAVSPFDDAMNRLSNADADVIAGFNLFMGKAQCGTCHFVPQFNGVKPPYVGSEFEVLGTPADTAYSQLSTDEGRYGVHPAKETMHAFRTGTVRNAAHTMPYMHNGVFATLEAVIDFYNNGGGAGKGLRVPNQTLSSDPLQLSAAEKQQLIRFIRALDEKVPFEAAPFKLPEASVKTWNSRVPGGLY
jgi:cytochrome c peroxidase